MPSQPNKTNEFVKRQAYKLAMFILSVLLIVAGFDMFANLLWFDEIIFIVGAWALTRIIKIING